MGKKRTSIVRASIVAIMVATSLIGQVSSAHAETTYRVAMPSDLKTIDPMGSGGVLRDFGFLVYDTLFAVDADQNVRPQMAEGYSLSDDGLVYTISLRDGLKFHDGTPVTAEDCVASLKRWGAVDTAGKKLFEFVDEVVATSEASFQIILKEPYGPTIESLAKYGAIVPFMLPKRLAEIDPATPITEAIGSGPFKFAIDEWRPGAQAVFVKNEDYVPRSEEASFLAGGKVVNIDRLEWLTISDPNTAVNALINSEIDQIFAPPHDLLPVLEAGDEVNVDVVSELGNQLWMRMNFTAAPLDQQLVRQAIMAAVDQEKYLQAVVGDPRFYRECYSVYACGTPLATDEGAELLKARDLEMAKAMLLEAGYTGETVAILQPTSLPVASTISVVTAELLRDIGMTVELEPMDWSTLAARRAKSEPVDEGGWSMFHTYWNAADVATPITNVGLTGGCFGSGWFGWPCDAELDALRDRYVRAYSLEERKDIATQLQKRALDLVTFIPLGVVLEANATRSNVSGIIQSPFPVFWNLTK